MHLNKDLKNRTIFCKDNLDILKNINSNCIDLIYLDPPFNKNKKFTAPIDSAAKVAGFKDIFRMEDLKDEWLITIEQDEPELYKFLKSIKDISETTNIKRTSNHYLYNYCYLSYMGVRLIEMYRVLKDTGSIYLHCDATMSHYIKIMMDIIFGEKNFRNEIVWWYPQSIKSSKKKELSNHDVIFCYCKNLNEVFFNPTIVPYNKKQIDRFKHKDNNGKFYYDTRRDKENIKKKVKVYLKKEGTPAGDTWYFNRVQGKEYVGYPTQKPLSLLERIIKASSNEGDIILDPFCGCATTCVAAEKLNRKWIGIDVGVKAYVFVKERMIKEIHSLLCDVDKDIEFKTDPPTRDLDNIESNENTKYVYIISNPAFKGMYKVGVAKDVNRRLNSYQTSDPDRAYKIEYKFKTNLYNEIEKHIHSKFNNKHEWVTGNLEDIKYSIENYK